jgi:hypothetical protein
MADNNGNGLASPDSATALKMKNYLAEKYAKLKQQTQERENRRKEFESSIQHQPNAEINNLRDNFNKVEVSKNRRQRKILRKDDFEPLELVGKGAFGEVVLVRLRDSSNNNGTLNRIFGRKFHHCNIDFVPFSHYCIVLCLPSFSAEADDEGCDDQEEPNGAPASGAQLSV